VPALLIVTSPLPSGLPLVWRNMTSNALRVKMSPPVTERIGRLALTTRSAEPAVHRDLRRNMPRRYRRWFILGPLGVTVLVGVVFDAETEFPENATTAKPATAAPAPVRNVRRPKVVVGLSGEFVTT